MKKLYAAAAVLAAGLMFGTGGASAAQVSLSSDIGASDLRPWADSIHEIGHKKHKKHRKHKNKHRKHKHKHYKKRHHNHNGHHHKHRNGGFFLNFGSPGPVIRYDDHHDQYARKCHGVVTDDYYRGRYAKVGATKCYGRAGEGYIVDGSRYLIHYY